MCVCVHDVCAFISAFVCTFSRELRLCVHLCVLCGSSVRACVCVCIHLCVLCIHLCVLCVHSVCVHSFVHFVCAFVCAFLPCCVHAHALLYWKRQTTSSSFLPPSARTLVSRSSSTSNPRRTSSPSSCVTWAPLPSWTCCSRWSLPQPCQAPL